MAVNPSDTAPALIALDAKMVIRTPKGERVVDAEDYFVGPDIDITHMNVLKPGDLLTAIRIPATWAGAQFYFEKVRDRNVWDFPLVNVASAMKSSGDTIEDIRIAVNGVAARPLRLKAVEDCSSRQAAQRSDRRNGRQAGGPGRRSRCNTTPTRFRSCAIWSSAPSAACRRQHGHHRVGDESAGDRTFRSTSHGS